MAFHDRLRWARVRRYPEAKNAADAMGVAAGTYGNHEAGSRRPRWETIEMYAKFFRVNLAWLAYGNGEMENTNSLPILGRVSAGNIIETESEQFDEGVPLFDVELPFQIPDRMFGLEVFGDSMYPRYDTGDVIIALYHTCAPDKLRGKEAIVCTKNGNRYIKRVAKGTTDKDFNLESHNAPTMYNVEIQWARSIPYVIRAGQWHMLDAAQRPRLGRRLPRIPEDD